MPKKSRRNRNKTTCKTSTKTTDKTNEKIKGLLPEEFDKLKYYISKYKQMKLAASIYKTIYDQGFPDVPEVRGNEYNKYLKTVSIIYAYNHYDMALNAYNILNRAVIEHKDKLALELYICIAKRAEVIANLYIYIHNKNYNKCLEYYVLLQKLFNKQLNFMMFEDLSYLEITMRGEEEEGESFALDISKDESVRRFAEFIKTENSKIEWLWTNFFNTEIPVVALE